MHAVHQRGVQLQRHSRQSLQCVKTGWGSTENGGGVAKGCQCVVQLRQQRAGPAQVRQGGAVRVWCSLPMVSATHFPSTCKLHLPASEQLCPGLTQTGQ